MEAPEQSHLMGEVVIDEVCKFPNDVSIDEPVPGKGDRKQRVRREQTDTISDHAKRNKLSNNPIEHVNKERDFILRSVEILMGKWQQDLYNNNEWNEGRKNGLNSLPGAQRVVVARTNDIDESLYWKEADDLAL